MAHSMDSKETLLETIKNLQELAQRSTNEHEAAAASAHVTRLLLKHNLTTRDVESFDLEEETIIETTEEFAGASGKATARTPLWKASLMFSVSKACLCAAFKTRGGRHFWGNQRRNSSYTFIGLKKNVDIAVYLYHYLERTIEDIGRQRFKEVGATGLEWRNSWFSGAVATVAKRLQEEMQTFKASDPACNAMVETKYQQAKEWMHEKHKIRSSAPSGARVNWSAYSDGAAAGKSIAIRKGVGGVVPGQRLIK